MRTRFTDTAAAAVGVLVLSCAMAAPAAASEGPLRFGGNNPYTGISWQHGVNKARAGVCGEFRSAAGSKRTVGAVRNETRTPVMVFAEAGCVGDATVVDPGEDWSVRPWTLKKATSYRFG
jgi:uncharacterized low-complexity protein